MLWWRRGIWYRTQLQCFKYSLVSHSLWQFCITKRSLHSISLIFGRNGKSKRFCSHIYPSRIYAENNINKWYEYAILFGFIRNWSLPIQFEFIFIFKQTSPNVNGYVSNGFWCCWDYGRGNNTWFIAIGDSKPIMINFGELIWAVQQNFEAKSICRWTVVFVYRCIEDNCQS